MSIAFIQTAFHAGTTGQTVANVTLSATAAGSLIAVGLIAGSDTNTVASVTDNQSNTYHQVPGALSKVTGSFMSDIWYTAGATAGVTTVTLTMTNGIVSDFNTYVNEYSGVATSSPVDTSGQLSNQSGAPLGPSLSITNSGSLLLAIYNPATVSITGVSAPWTNAGIAAGSGWASYLPGVSGTYQAAFTPTTSQSGCASGVAFLPPISTRKKASMIQVF